MRILCVVGYLVLVAWVGFVPASILALLAGILVTLARKS